MLNLKKVIASICVIALTLSTVAFAANYSDVTVDSAYYEAVETLSKLNIVTGYEDGTYKPEETVTRAEMAALIARIQGFGETAKAGAETIFTDVPKAHWASGYVAQAANQGIINGYGDGTFGPEDTVTYEQAVKMIMATLGYTPFAEFNGGYPTGYLTAATRYNVTDGVSNAVVGSGANRGTIAQLLNNAIDTPIMVQDAWTTSGEVTYIVCDGSEKSGNKYRTLMSEYLSVVKLKGVVESSSLVDIEAVKSINTEKDAEVRVDITGNFETSNKDFKMNSDGTYGGTVDTFLVGGSDAEKFVGKAVLFYVVKNAEEDKWEIVSIAEDTARNDVVEIDLALFDSVDTTDNEIEYLKDADSNNTIGASYEAGIKVVFNNEYVGNNESALTSVLGLVAATNSGKITLIDNDTVNGADVAFIEVAATAVVKKASEEGVAFKTGAALLNGDVLTELEVDAEDETKVVVITKDGEVVAPETLVEWDVLSILAASETSDYILAEVVSNAIVGTVQASYSSTSSDGGVGYKIDGNKYDIALRAYGKADIKVGAGGTFYIDKYGRIAAFNEDAALATGVSGSFGFVLNHKLNTGDINGDGIQIQFLTANGVETFNMASRATLYTASAIDGDYDGGTTTSKETTLKLSDINAWFVGPNGADDSHAGDDVQVTTDTLYFRSQTLIGNVVKYTKNSADEITSITLAGADDFALVQGNTSGAFDAENNKLGRYIDSDATIFFVGTSTGSGVSAPYAKDKSLVGTIADLEDKFTYSNVDFYATDDAIDNDIIVVYNGLGSVGNTAALAVIADIATAENEDGDTIKTITYFMNGEEKTADTVAWNDITNVVGTLTIGDIVKLKVNSAGLISDIKTVWDFADGVVAANKVVNDYALDYPGGNPGSASTGEYFVGGPVASYKATSEEIAFFSGNAADSSTYKLSKATNVYVVDPTGRSVAVKNGSSASFRCYDALYSDTHTATATVDGVVQFTAETLPSANIKTFATGYVDNVFLRLYDGKIVDVVIVKADKDGVKVSEAGTIGTTYTLTYDANSTGQSVPSPATVNEGAIVTLPAAPAGYHWSKTTTGAAITTITVTANTTVYCVVDPS